MLNVIHSIAVCATSRLQENQVLECILTCLLLPSIGPVTLSPGARHDDAAIMANGAPGEHWELRTFAAGMLALANQRYAGVAGPRASSLLVNLKPAV